MKRIMVLGAILFGVFIGMLLTPAQAQVGIVWAWGDNTYGQLGDGTNTRRYTAFKIPNLTGIIQVSGGYSHSLALRLNGTVWAWGTNSSGQIGNGTNIDSLVPVQVSGLVGVVQVASGGYHSLALKSNGTVWAWGSNQFGELGDGTTTGRNIPVQVFGITNMTQIAGGAFHSLALKSDGTVWAWGRGSDGQLGDGKRTEHYTPIQVPGLSNVIQIIGGWGHSVALKSDGTVWAWGGNYYGELGDGTNTPRLTPVQVFGLTSVIQIGKGGEHTLALKSDGTLWAWGFNDQGQLGDGTNNDSNTPVQTSGLSNIVQIAGGERHSLAVKSDGTVWAWGANDWGQLGDGTTESRGTPAQVKNPAKQNFISGGGDFCLSVQSAILGTSISAKNASLAYGNAITLSATLKNAIGGLLLNEPLTFSIDENPLGVASTYASGSAAVGIPNPLSLSIGDHTIAVNFAGDRLNKPSSKTITLTITKAVTAITLKPVSGRPGDTKVITAILKRVYDNAVLPTRTLTFKIDGNLVGTADTDGTGTATLSYKFDETYSVGSHVLTAEYAGDDTYKAVVKKGTLTVAKAPVKVVSSSKSGKVGSIVALQAKLTRKTDGSLLVGRTIHFNIDDSEVGSIATDGNGLAILNYTIPSTLGKGLHVITVLFDGDSLYLSMNNSSAILTVK